MRLIYVVPHLNFFQVRHCGSIAHAKGILRAFNDAGWFVELVCGGIDADHRSDLESRATKIHYFDPSELSAGYSHAVSRLLPKIASNGANRGDIILLRHSTKCTPRLLGSIRAQVPDIPIVVEVNSLLCHRKRFVYPIRELLRCLESTWLREADLIYSVSAELTQHINRAPISRNQFVTCMNGADPYKGDRLKDCRDEPHVVYLGNLNAYDGLAEMLATYAPESSKLGFTVKVVGDGALLPRLRRQFAECPSIRFYGHIPLSDAVDKGVINKSSIGLVSYCPPNIPIGSPTKLLDFLSYGVPVVTSPVGQPASIVSTFKVGWILSNRTERWMSGLADCIKNQEQMETWRSNIERNYSDNFLWESTLLPLVSKCHSMVSDQDTSGSG